MAWPKMTERTVTHNPLRLSRAVCHATLALLFLLAAKGLRAQQPGATLRGTVSDGSGTPLAGATVTTIHVATAETFTATTDAQGEFTLSNLPPGIHEVQAVYSDFRSEPASEVQLTAGVVTTANFTLSTSAAASAVEGESGAGSASRISESQLAGLPLNGRSYSQLATLQSQISDPFGGSASRGTGSGNLTVAGGRSTSNNFLLDGSSVMDTDNRVPRSAAGVQLGSDAVLQVQVFATQYGAEYGRGSGGVLNSITRSGSDELHGTLFEYFRNSKLDARNFFDAGPEPTPFKRNQFGFTITGPVRREQTYFMTSFEWLRDRLTQTSVDFFPNEETRQGFPDSDGVPTVPVHPSIEPYLSLYPLPNAGTVRRGVGENRAPQFLPTNESFLTGRIDHRVSEHDGLFGRYTFDDASSQSPQVSALFNALGESRQQYLTLVGSHIFSPTVVSSFRFGYTRPVTRQNALSFIDIPRSLYFVPTAESFGQISVGGLTALGPAPFMPTAKIMNSFQYAADLILDREDHALKFGLQVHRYRWDVFTSFNQPGFWSFSSLESFLGAGADGTANLNVALPGSDNRRAFRQTMIGMYLQDGYQLRPGLRFDMGLRYEFTTLIRDRDGRTAYLLDPLRDTEPRVGPVLGDNPSLLNISPRLGISWSPRRGMVMRAGAGLYYDQMVEYVFEQQKNSVPFYRIATRTTFDASEIFPDAVTGGQGVPLLARTFDYNNISSPRVVRYNASLQQEAGGWDLQVSYVGARGNHLFRGFENNLFPVPVRQPDGSLFFPPFTPGGPDNRVNPAFGSVGYMLSDAQSFYNSAQVSASRAFGSDISWRIGYTYSKSVDDASEQSFNFGQYGPDRTLDRALSDYDLRHRFITSFFYSPPFGSGKAFLNSGIWAHLFGGWRVGGILTLRSGPPFSPEVNVRRSGYLFSPSRPNLKPGRDKNPTSGVSEGCGDIPAGTPLGTRDMYFDLCAYAVPPAGTLGNAGRNTLISPPVFNMDLSLQKDIALDSERTLQFRGEIFNLPNRTNLDPRSGPSPDVFTGSSGRLNTIAARIGGTATTARQIQFALRLSF